MAATTALKPPCRPTLLRRVAAVLAITAVLLLGVMSTAVLAAPTSARTSHKAVAPSAAQPVPASRPAAAVLPLVLGAIVILAAYNPVPRFYGGGRY